MSKLVISEGEPLLKDSKDANFKHKSNNSINDIPESWRGSGATTDCQSTTSPREEPFKKINFKFTSHWEMRKHSFCCEFWVYMFLVLYCLAYPTMWVMFYVLEIDNPFGDKMHYFAILYVLILNLLVVRLVGRYIISAIAYPFSNVCARKFLKKQLNSKFGSEFAKRLEHLSSVLSSFASQGCKMSPSELP
jgi:hypothetical protein